MVRIQGSMWRFKGLEYMFPLLILLCVATFPSSMEGSVDLGYSPEDLTSEEMMMDRFKQWVAEYGKAYNDDHEKQIRFEIFKDNLRYIHDHNKQNLSYLLGLTEFADYSPDERKTSSCWLGSHPKKEVKTSCNCLGGSHPKNNSPRYQYDDGDLPGKCDWRKKGAVTSVKTQKCRDCWAFSSVGAVERNNKIVNNKLFNLSQQQLVDCDTANEDCCRGDLA